MADARDVSSVVLGRRELVIPSEADDYRYLTANWRDVYLIIRPGIHANSWMAVARFGNHDELIGASADELLDLIRRHYGPDTEGYPFTARRISA